MQYIRLAFVSPEINPQSRKAKSIPILNPFNPYGRVFFFSWLGFMIAFLSWYAFPPLLTVTIKKDLNMSATEVANSNIVALLGTFLMRLLAGPLCDRFGPRLVLVGLLLAGAIPTAMAGLVTTPTGLIALRFFVGVLGATFVPCQVWCTGFFDKNVVGTANALAGGWGNAGGGITYFVMPAVFDSLVYPRGLKPHQAWRVAYIVPFVLIVVVAVSMLLTCEDMPTGKWSERHIWMKETPFCDAIDTQIETPLNSNDPSSSASINNLPTDAEKDSGTQTPIFADRGATQPGAIGHVALYDPETVISPTFREASSVIFSLSTLSLAAPYACSFGSELAINSILGAYYAKNFPHMGQTQSGRWAAMFGLLNVACRPAGGFVGDLIYRATDDGSVWMKKIWLSTLGLLMGGFQAAIGLSNPKNEATMFGLMAALAFFLEACNGANFAVVPHVHPYANGIVSGIVGGMGNFGGIIFAIIFRYNGSHYDRALWIIGVIAISVNLAVCWIRPVPRQMRSI